jgi:hypothetical protein
MKTQTHRVGRPALVTAAAGLAVVLATTTQPALATQTTTGGGQCRPPAQAKVWDIEAQIAARHAQEDPLWWSRWALIGRPTG